MCASSCVKPRTRMIPCSEPEGPVRCQLPNSASRNGNSGQLCSGFRQLDRQTGPVIRFLEPEKVLVEVFLARPGGAVDALQLGVVRIAAPIGARDVHQLERLSEPASRGQMRTDAQIDKIALAIEADLLLARDLADIFGLVALAEPVEERDGLVAIPNLAGDRLVAAHDVAHTLFDTRQIDGG